MSDVKEVRTCPSCGNASSEILSIEGGMREALTKVMAEASIPNQICRQCYTQLTSQVSQGAKLRIQQQNRDKNRAMLWKSRVNLIKHARQLMAQKAYPEAAMNYEKYIKVLEISFDAKPGDLKPDIFGKSSRSKELTVIATAYWDLMRIYDTNPAYRERMVVASRKLAEFLPFSPIFPDVISRANSFAPSAKNPDIIKKFLRDTKSVKSRCLVASSAFEDKEHSTVEMIRKFRDRRLLNNALGIRFVLFYNRNSDRWAAWLDHHRYLKSPVRAALHVFAFFTNKFS